MLSSASLFHFTSDLQTLKSILTGSFLPFYALENLDVFGVPACPGIPMVSFCDIPLSQSGEHAKKYGDYALGLNKSWGMKKRISPVHYIYPKSMCALVVKHIFDRLGDEQALYTCDCMRFNNDTAIFFYAKPYTNPDDSKVKYYNEREWRYIPFAETLVKGNETLPDERITPMISRIDFYDEEKRKAATDCLHEHYELTFEADDIEHIIVKRKEEIPEMVDVIEKMDCDDESRKMLLTRLISMERIEDNF